MTKRKKIYGIVVFLLVSAACILSCYYGFRQGLKAGSLTASLAEVMHYSDFYAEQLRNADCEGVQKAIIDHLAVIEKYKDIDGSLISGEAYFMDKMLDHVRLSMIENHLGNKQSSEEHMDIALKACKELKWKECTKEKLLYFAQRIHKKNPIVCLSGDN